MTSEQTYKYDQFQQRLQTEIPALFHDILNIFHSDILWRFNQTSLQNKLQKISAMETVKQETTELKKPTEKERLELVEKRVEIQKKRLEIKKEKMTMSKMILEKEKEHLELSDKKVSIRTKQLENKKAKLDMEELLENRNLESNRLLNDKIFSVLFSLMVSTIDTERTILGSEPFYTPLLNGKHRDIALDKLMELIKRI